MVRAALYSLLSLAVLAASFSSPPPVGQSVNGAEGSVAGLKDRLEKGLKARRPVEFEFVAKVVGEVESGRLPVEVVDKVFFWARKEHPQRPFQHFQFAITEMARKFGVLL